MATIHTGGKVIDAARAMLLAVEADQRCLAVFDWDDVMQTTGRDMAYAGLSGPDVPTDKARYEDRVWCPGLVDLLKQFPERQIVVVTARDANGALDAYRQSHKAGLNHIHIEWTRHAPMETATPKSQVIEELARDEGFTSVHFVDDSEYNIRDCAEWAASDECEVSPVVLYHATNLTDLRPEGLSMMTQLHHAHTFTLKCGIEPTDPDDRSPLYTEPHTHPNLLL